jgi:ribosomal protein L37AE/L43A
MKTSIGKQEQNRYLQNKEAKTGETIKCPICGEVFIKKQYSQAFCCKECKGYYRNAAKPDRHKDKNYNHKYNQSHPERLDRGFTKGYNNGNISDGVKENRNTNIWYDSSITSDANNSSTCLLVNLSTCEALNLRSTQLVN